MTEISLAQLVDDVKEAFIAADLDGNITHWNAYAEELYGWRRHEVLGRRVTMLAAPSMAETGEKVLASLLRGSTWAGAFTNKRRDGNEIEVFAIVAPVMREGKLIGTFGVSVPLNVESRDVRVAALTTRERQVLRLTVAAKKSNEVAALLGLSRRTVESHLSNIYGKLGIGSRSELMLFAIRNGILSP
ncbi:MAG TPA: LuxR C-terminal-related transcriptional regulator [Thermoanaerobaculia bacterium]|nr:LuxR C-terminal-related transcriptional regulator [Thermoanaerobaculia bacterium]